MSGESIAPDIAIFSVWGICIIVGASPVSFHDFKQYPTYVCIIQYMHSLWCTIASKYACCAEQRLVHYLHTLGCKYWMVQQSYIVINNMPCTLESTMIVHLMYAVTVVALSL